MAVGLLGYILQRGAFELLCSSWGLRPHAAVIAVVALSGIVWLSFHALTVRPGVGQPAGDANGVLWLLCVILYPTLLRLLFCSQIELLPEEAYYWNYSQHLDWGYLDHPPMVAWLIKVGTTFFGNTEFGVRAGALACGAITSFFMYGLTRSLFGRIPAAIAVGLVQLLPYFFLSGFLMTPDAPLSTAWAASLFFLQRALLGGHAKAWYAAGAALGVGLLSKYSIALLGLAALGYMACVPAARSGFKRPAPYVAALIAVAIFAPVIFWNYQNEWASFAFQTSRRLAERPQFALHKLIGSALLLITPIGVITWIQMLLGRRSRWTHPGDRALVESARPFVAIATLVPISVFLVFSLRHDVKVDWTGAPWTGALPLMAYGVAYCCHGEGRQQHPRLRRQWAVTAACLLAVYGFGFLWLSVGLPGVGYPAAMELAPVGWRDLSTQIARIADGIDSERGAPVLVVGMDRYAIASELAFYGVDQARSIARTSAMHMFGGVGLMYERWFPKASLGGRQLLLVSFDRREINWERLQHHTDRAGPIRAGDVTRNHRQIRPFYYRSVYGYRP